MPIYNAEKYLVRSLDSVLRQTYQDYELICVTDGSTDGSLRILEEYKKIFQDKLLLISTSNRGESSARNTGLDIARGEWISFLDADDAIEPEFLDKMLDCLMSSGADMAVCGFRRINQKTGKAYTEEMTSRRDIITDLTLDDSIAFINVGLPNKLIKKNVIGSNRLPPVRIALDMLFMLGLFPEIQKIVFVPQPLYRYYVHRNSVIMVNLPIWTNSAKRFLR